MGSEEIRSMVDRIGGNSDRITQSFYDSLAIEMRVINSCIASTRMTFLGEEFDTPLMLGVIGYFPSMGEDAVEQAALAAKELNTVLWLSNYETDEQVRSAAATGAKVIRCIKPFRDYGRWIDMLKGTEELGCFAAATDVDHCFNSKGTWDDYTGSSPRTTEQLAEAAEMLKIPFIVKGCLSVHDAVEAKKAGAKGCILSHHHNIMNWAVPPAMIAPDVKKAVGEDFAVLVDSGIRTGAEAFKALALGADGLCVARPFMVPLTEGRKDGVVEFFTKMNGELRSYLNRTGSKDIRSIDPGVLHRIGWFPDRAF